MKRKPRIRKNDVVMVIAGRDRGKTGKVLKVYPAKSTAIVEGINFVKKHMRRSRQDQQGGIIQRESPVRFSNIAVYCKSCSRPTRVGLSVLSDGSKSRYCKKCREML